MKDNPVENSVFLDDFDKTKKISSFFPFCDLCFLSGNQAYSACLNFISSSCC